jgi:hypothetical protein
MGKREKVDGKESLHKAGCPTGYTFKAMFETNRNFLSNFV